MKRQPRFVVYQDDLYEYRWRLLAGNGQIIADSAESYTRKRDALRAVDAVLVAIFYAQIVVHA